MKFFAATEHFWVDQIDHLRLYEHAEVKRMIQISSNMVKPCWRLFEFSASEVNHQNGVFYGPGGSDQQYSFVNQSTQNKWPRWISGRLNYWFSHGQCQLVVKNFSKPGKRFVIYHLQFNATMIVQLVDIDNLMDIT